MNAHSIYEVKHRQRCQYVKYQFRSDIEGVSIKIPVIIDVHLCINPITWSGT